MESFKRAGNQWEVLKFKYQSPPDRLTEVGSAGAGASWPSDRVRVSHGRSKDERIDKDKVSFQVFISTAKS